MNSIKTHRQVPGHSVKYSQLAIESLTVSLFIALIFGTFTMHILYYILDVLAWSTTAIMTSLQPAVPDQVIALIPRAYPSSSAEFDMTQLYLEDIEKRQAQKVLMPCPEYFEDSPQSCVACGGENRDKPGRFKHSNPSGRVCDCERCPNQSFSYSIQIDHDEIVH